MRGASPTGFVGRSTTFAALLPILLAAPAVKAVQASAVLRISVNVAAYSRIQVLLPRFLVSERDIARGYVDVQTPVVIAVVSNLREGYTLLFATRGDQVQEAVVSGPGIALQVGPDGAQTARPAAGRGLWNDTVQLRMRLTLSKTATPGEHPWPIAISIAS